MTTEPEMVVFDEELEYEDYYVNNYCCNPVVTFDDITVAFPFERFEHAFSRTNTSTGLREFNYQRARRISWIRYVLEVNTNTELLEGWDGKKKRYTRSKRATLYDRKYLVIIRFTDSAMKKAKFVTAYPPDEDTLRKLDTAPSW